MDIDEKSEDYGLALYLQKFYSVMGLNRIGEEVRRNS